MCAKLVAEQWTNAGMKKQLQTWTSVKAGMRQCRNAAFHFRCCNNNMRMCFLFGRSCPSPWWPTLEPWMLLLLTRMKLGLFLFLQLKDGTLISGYLLSWRTSHPLWVCPLRMRRGLNHCSSWGEKTHNPKGFRDRLPLTYIITVIISSSSSSFFVFGCCFFQAAVLYFNWIKGY